MFDTQSLDPYNLRKVDTVDAGFKTIVHQLYRELGEKCDDFNSEKVSGTVLISAPRAIVYLHIDAPVVRKYPYGLEVQSIFMIQLTEDRLGYNLTESLGKGAYDQNVRPRKTNPLQHSAASSTIWGVKMLSLLMANFLCKTWIEY